jgi:hypothetical protein
MFSSELEADVDQRDAHKQHSLMMVSRVTAISVTKKMPPTWHIKAISSLTHQSYYFCREVKTDLDRHLFLSHSKS